jgi:hypothetical protein
LRSPLAKDVGYLENDDKQLQMAARHRREQEESRSAQIYQEILAQKSVDTSNCSQSPAGVYRALKSLCLFLHQQIHKG